MRQDPNRQLIVSQIQRDYETNGVSAAENQFRDDMLLSISSFRFLNIKVAVLLKI